MQKLLEIIDNYILWNFFVGRETKNLMRITKVLKILQNIDCDLSECQKEIESIDTKEHKNKIEYTLTLIELL